MEEILELLVGPYEIRRIIIDNFAMAGKEVCVEAELDSNQYGLKTIIFRGVTNISCNPECYHTSETASISSLDISDKGWDGVKYRVDILQEAFSFYCGSIEVN